MVVLKIKRKGATPYASPFRGWPFRTTLEAPTKGGEQCEPDLGEHRVPAWDLLEDTSSNPRYQAQFVEGSSKLKTSVESGEFEPKAK